jgi:hypothetical protein
MPQLSSETLAAKAQAASMDTELFNEPLLEPEQDVLLSDS